MCHVLVIEDDYLIATQIAEAAMLAGASTIDLASTQNGAIAAALAHRPALILSDVRLREGTGPGAVQAITALLGAIPVVYITGSPEQCAAPADCATILIKPFVRQTLITVMQGLVPA